ncbi:hypothetical protein BCD67_12475 [Oscillatoriales cyanobacterium USR001]|nr:hypothetical protein BCD67_12475 [Oscillatoriales cyanobacterium USR001]
MPTFKFNKLWVNRRNFTLTYPFESGVVRFDSSIYLFRSTAKDPWPARLTLSSVVSSELSKRLPSGSDRICALGGLFAGLTVPIDSILVSFQRVKF